MNIDIPNHVIEMIREDLARLMPVEETSEQMVQRFAENSGRRKALLQMVMDRVPAAKPTRDAIIPLADLFRSRLP